MSIQRTDTTGVAQATDPEKSSARRRLKKRVAKAWSDRASFDAQNRDIAQHMLPRRARFSQSETNQGYSRSNDKILNGTATKCIRTGGAGMHAGLTSPARPWHILGIDNPEMMDDPVVKAILAQIVERQRTVFSGSNFYNALAQAYEDLFAFATTVIWVDEDEDDTIRCYVLPWGEYVLWLDARMAPTGLGRKHTLSVGQIKERGWLSKCSQKIKDKADRQEWDDTLVVVHVVEKRIERDITKVDGSNMPWASYWFEEDADDDAGFLKESGYRTCPFVAARWGVTGSDTYGTGPAHDALGDVKGLQQLEREAALTAALHNKPPMAGPASMRAMGGPTIQPNGMNYLDSASSGQKFEQVIKTDVNSVTVFDAKIERQERRIKEIFYSDLWLMLTQTDRREMTAREVDEKHEEKMLQLGPVLTRLHNEMLEPLIDRVFDIMDARGMFNDLWPHLPEEIQGAPLKVEFISILAQAQKQLAAAGVERFVAFIGNVANARPDVLDRINWDEMVRHYGDILGVKPDLLLPDEVVMQIRQARQAAQAQQMQMEKQMADAKAAKDLAGAKMGEDNALARMVGAAMPGQPAPAPASPERVLQ